MLLSHLLIIAPIEALIGILIGFFLCNKEDMLSVEQIKLGAIVFIVANGFIIWHNPKIDLFTLAHLATSWFVLSIGIVIGEIFRHKIISDIITNIRKKDVQLAISDFIRITTQVSYCPDKINQIDEQLKLVSVELDKLAGKANRIGDEDMAKKFESIKDLCAIFSSYSHYISSEEDECKRAKLLQQWLEIGNELTSLSWDTLNHAEENVRALLIKKGVSSHILSAYRS